MFLKPKLMFISYIYVTGYEDANIKLDNLTVQW